MLARVRFVIIRRDNRVVSGSLRLGIKAYSRTSAVNVNEGLVVLFKVLSSLIAAMHRASNCLDDLPSICRG